MRFFDAATAAYFAAREGIVSRVLFQITARNIATDVVENLRLSSGADLLTLPIAGADRTYLPAAHAMMQAEPITAVSGLEVRTYQMRLAAASAQVEDLVKGYDTRFAPVEVHRALFYASTRNLVAEPRRVFRGVCNSIDFPRGPIGEVPACVIELVSETRVLTRTLAQKKSDESQQARGGDRFRRYAAISGSVPIYWGELRAAAPADPAPTTTTPQEREDLGR